LTRVTIKENSFIAYLASQKLKTSSCAIVIGKTIFLHNCSMENFVSNVVWLRHELKHIEQYQQEGLLFFIVKYIAYSIRYGYENNPFEIEAKLAEHDEILTTKYTFKN
jgi:hypothetical protein